MTARHEAQLVERLIIICRSFRGNNELILELVATLSSALCLWYKAFVGLEALIWSFYKTDLNQPTMWPLIKFPQIWKHQITSSTNHNTFVIGFTEQRQYSRQCVWIQTADCSACVIHFIPKMVINKSCKCNQNANASKIQAFHLFFDA